MPNGVEFEGRLAHVGTFPIGIEPSSFIDVSLQHSMRTPPFADAIFQFRTSKGSLLSTASPNSSNVSAA